MLFFFIFFIPFRGAATTGAATGVTVRVTWVMAVVSTRDAAVEQALTSRRVRSVRRACGET